jgi:ATP-dependent protease HslVU (ClpYQ) peptidase subunit
VLQPVADASYTLTCTGAGGEVFQTALVTVTPAPPAPTLTLTATPNSIQEGEMTTVAWDAQNATACTASNDWTGDKPLTGNEVLQPAADASYALTCIGVGGEVSQTALVTVTPAPPAPTLTLTATPNSIQEGETTTVAWDAQNATACTASNDWSGDKPLTGNEVLQPVADASYTLTCTGAGGEVFQTVLVTVTPAPPAPTLTLTATPNSIQEGETTTVAWDAQNATSCTASNDWTGDKALAGNEVLQPVADANYTLACIGAGGEVSQTALVTVTPAPPAPTLTLTATPNSIQEGETTTVAWDAQNATACTASNDWTGDKALTGNEVLQPIADASYTLTCTGAGGEVFQTALVTVTPAPPAPTLT